MANLHDNSRLRHVGCRVGMNEPAFQTLNVKNAAGTPHRFRVM